MSVTDLTEEIPGVDRDGRPDPDYADDLGLVDAVWFARTAAFVIDIVLLAVVLVPFGIGLSMWVKAAPAFKLVGPLSTAAAVLMAVGGVLGLICGVIQIAVHGQRGVTLGKSLLSLRSVDVVHFGKIGFGRAAKRVAVLLGSGVFFLVVGPTLLLISGLWDREHRGRNILDHLAGCWVVDIRDGLDPFDTRALRRAHRGLRVGEITSDEVLRPMSSGSGHVPKVARSRAAIIGAGGVGSRWEDMSQPPAIAPAPAAPGMSLTQPQPVQVALAPPPPGIGARVQAPVALRQESLVLRFDDGEHYTVAGSALLGRSPSRLPDDPDASLIALTDPTRELSKTHVEVRLDTGGWWVRDRGSSNGTVVNHPDGRARVLAPGQRELLQAGTTVRLGGRAFIVEPGQP